MFQLVIRAHRDAGRAPAQRSAVRAIQGDAGRCPQAVSTPAAITPAGTRPSVRWPRSAWLAWLESTDPLLWWDRAEPKLWYDSSEAADIADAIDPAEANEPMLANDAKEAALPTERIESWEQIERTEFSDQRDHTRRSVAFVGSTVFLCRWSRCLPRWLPARRSSLGGVGLRDAGLGHGVGRARCSGEHEGSVW